MRWLAAAALVTGCATEPSVEGGRPDGDWFELEPGLFVPLTFDGKADLPNAQFSARPLDTSGYRAIADKFIAAGMDVKVVPEVVAGYTWPLSDSRAVLNRQGTPIRLGYEVYEHTGLDIIRLAETESSVVRAPTTGTAIITDWAGDQWYPNGDYSTVLSIWDPRTHHIVQLMHVEVDPTLPKGRPFEVQKGQFVGELADIFIPGGMHTHVNVIDAESFTLIDPVTVMAQYGDTTPPTIGEVYVLDAATQRSPSLQTGPLDLVITPRTTAMTSRRATSRSRASPTPRRISMAWSWRSSSAASSTMRSRRSSTTGRSARRRSDSSTSATRARSSPAFGRARTSATRSGCFGTP